LGILSLLRKGAACHSTRMGRAPATGDEKKEAGKYFSRELGDSYREFWDGMARTQEGAYLGVAGLPFGQPATEESLDLHGKGAAEIIAKKLDLTGNDTVLEVGVGVGRLARHIAPLVREFHGVDISPNMIRHARERCRDLNNIFLYAHPSSDLSLFPSQKFDAIYFQVVLIHLDREDAFHYLREARRVLKPGGRLWAQFYNLLHPKGFKEFVFAVDYGIEQGGKVRGRVQCYTSDEARQFVTGAGFIIDETKSHLERIDQRFNFDIPDLDWEYYLIAVATTPT